MRVRRRLNYYRRVYAAYLTRQKSQLTFWHEVPEVNQHFRPGELGQYYMTFTSKADYQGQYDPTGIPLLNYHGTVGLQYNPIAVAQYGLANYNLFRRTGDPERRRRFLRGADWLVANLEQNYAGLSVWHHKFDWDYRTLLKAPWYSALAQGQGISLLVRTHGETGSAIYLETAREGFQPFLKAVGEGGVTFTGRDGDTWFEEYIVSPPTHILNGFIWATWGVYDYFLATRETQSEALFAKAVETLAGNLHRYDTGFWSLYEQADLRLKMLASPFYHALHIAQLQVMYRLTGRQIFREYAERWQVYRRDPLKQARALVEKICFKLVHY